MTARVEVIVRVTRVDGSTSLDQVVLTERIDHRRDVGQLVRALTTQLRRFADALDLQTLLAGETLSESVLDLLREVSRDDNG